MTMPDTQGGGTPATGVEAEGQQSAGARDQMRKVKEQVVGQAKTTFREARDRASSSLSDSRRQAADQVGGIASALHSAGRHLREEQQERIGGLADSLAGQVDQVADYLRDADLQRLSRDLENLSRRQPALVFGAAFALGLLGARFLKSSEQRADRERRWEDSEEYRGYEPVAPGGPGAASGPTFEPPEPISAPPRSTLGGPHAGA